MLWPAVNDFELTGCFAVKRGGLFMMKPLIPQKYMTTKAINKAIDGNKVVTVGDDLHHRICRDMFGQLVVVSLIAGEPTRLATLSDRRKAKIQHM